MFRFAEPDMLYLLLLIPAMALVFWFASRARAKRIARFGNPETIAQLMPESSPVRRRNKFILMLIGLALIVVGLARPQFGSKLKEVSGEGVELMFVVDVSNSMLAEDFEPSRLERTKFSINRLLEGLSQDKVGLIVFAGDAYVQLPITADYTAARNFVSQISPNMVTMQGTAIGSAIDLAVSSFSSGSEGSRVIILVSDGENHEDDAIGAAKRAAEKGVTIYAVGVGTPDGVGIMLGGDYIRDEEGNVVLSKLDEATLREVALVTGGAYITASKQSIGLEDIIAKVRETEKTQFSTNIYDEFDEQFQYMLGAGLVFVLLGFLMLERKSRILSRFNIFKKDN